VSLNRFEDVLLGYLRSHPDEERHWRTRVLELDRAGAPLAERTAALERELRAYAGERARADGTLAEAPGSARVSLRNLSEHLFRLWVPPRPKPPRSSPPSGREPSS
jgi:hypothetical protein